MVELTPEEKQKIYLEEKARLEAQEQLRKESEIKRETERKKVEEIEEMLSPDRAENFKGNIGALIGAAFLLISFFFPWQEALDRTFYVFRVATFSAVTVAIVCALTIAFALIGWFSNRNRLMGISTAVAGGIAAAISIFHTSRIEEILKSESFFDIRISSGAGLTVCVIGAILLLVSGVYMAFQGSEEDLSDLEVYLND